MLFEFRKKYVLMHKDIPVLEAPYSFREHSFAGSPAVLNKTHLPAGSLKGGEVSLNRLNHWWHWRGIPDYRVGLDRLLDNLGISSPAELLDKEYGLSVSDHYWIRSAKDNIRYDDISFFHRSFDQNGFASAMFSANRFKAKETALYTPNNTLAGYHQKAWMHRRDGLVLLKGGSPFFQQEPLNEWLAARIAGRLGISCVPYVTEVFEDRLVSVCPNMLDEKTELVTAADILMDADITSGQFPLDDYLDLLEKKGITDIRSSFSGMLVIDYLMMNSDRHDQNHGILIDAETMAPLRMAPVFDSGTGLGCLVKDSLIDREEEKDSCRLFGARSFSHEDLPAMITGLDKYDLTALSGIDEEYTRMLEKYRRVSGMTARRIESLAGLLNRRIEKLKQHQLGIVK